MSIRCNCCGQRHDIWDECPPGQKSKVLVKEKSSKEKIVSDHKKFMHPEALKIAWNDGRVTLLLGASFTQHHLVKKVTPLYSAKDGGALSYVAAANQLAFSMHQCTLSELDDKTAEHVRHLARVTVNAAAGVSQ